MASIFFYVSGHGFGHASREIEVMNAVAARLPGWQIVVRTAASRWLFDRTATAPITRLEGPCDTGVVQIDSLHPDEPATVRTAQAFYARLPQLVQEEAGRLRRHDARLVIADAPPLACAAAAEAGVPSVVLSNFTWDWIYEAYPFGSAPEVIPAIQSAYRQASEAWRLPFHGGFSTFSRIIDVPLVARRASVPAPVVRERLGLPRGVRIALVSFGGYGLEGFDPGRLDCAADWQVVFTGRAPHGPLPRCVRMIGHDAVFDAGLRYEDLVAAVDAVVTKPGYGILSECVANGTAMLYTSRGPFPEYDVMVREMPAFIRCRYIGHEDLLAGRWRDALDRLLAMPAPPPAPRADGAEVVADMIAARLGR